jgi:hypothetical protein
MVVSLLKLDYASHYHNAQFLDSLICSAANLHFAHINDESTEIGPEKA